MVRDRYGAMRMRRAGHLAHGALKLADGGYTRQARPGSSTAQTSGGGSRPARPAVEQVRAACYPGRTAAARRRRRLCLLAPAQRLDAPPAHARRPSRDRNRIGAIGSSCRSCTRSATASSPSTAAAPRRGPSSTSATPLPVDATTTSRRSAGRRSRSTTARQRRDVSFSTRRRATSLIVDEIMALLPRCAVRLPLAQPAGGRRVDDRVVRPRALEPDRSDVDLRGALERLVAARAVEHERPSPSASRMSSPTPRPRQPRSSGSSEVEPATATAAGSARSASVAGSATETRTVSYQAVERRAARPLARDDGQSAAQALVRGVPAASAANVLARWATTSTTWPAPWTASAPGPAAWCRTPPGDWTAAVVVAARRDFSEPAPARGTGVTRDGGRRREISETIIFLHIGTSRLDASARPQAAVPTLGGDHDPGPTAAARGHAHGLRPAARGRSMRPTVDHGAYGVRTASSRAAAVHLHHDGPEPCAAGRLAVPLRARTPGHHRQ